MKIAVSPEFATGQLASGTAADDFIDFMNQITATRYGTNQPVGTWLDTNDTIVRFNSESEFIQYIKNPSYSQDINIPAYSALVVFKSGKPEFGLGQPSSFGSELGEPKPWAGSLYSIM